MKILLHHGVGATGGGWRREYSYPADVCQRASQGPPWLSVTGSLTSGPGPPGSHPPAAVWKQKQSFFHWLQQWVTYWQKFQLPPPPPPPPPHLQLSANKDSQLFTDYNGQPRNGKSSSCPPFPLQQSGKQKQSFFHWLQQSATQWPKAPLPDTLQQSEN